MDRFYKWKHSKAIFGEMGRIVQGKSTWTWSETWRSYKNRKHSDPFSNLTKIAEMNSLAGLQSVFYIMTTEENHPLNINDYKVDELKGMLLDLISAGAEIGIHPGIQTFNDEQKMASQKEALESVIGQSVKRSRQHYLKYEYPETFRKLESVGIENDSSILVDLSSVENAQMRSTYKMFEDSNSRITQTPLVFMDTHHMQESDEAILKKLEDSISPAKKNGGEVMILWHNNNISNNREIGLYKEALEVISN